MKYSKLVEFKKLIQNRLENKKYSIIDIMLEGGAGGRMMHPYDDNSLTIGNIKEIILDAASGILDDKGKPRSIEKLDGANIHFSLFIDAKDGNVDPHKDVYFIRAKGSATKEEEQLNMDEMKAKWSGHPAEKTFILGCEAIAQACSKIPVDIITNVFNTPDPEVASQVDEKHVYMGTYVNTEIIFPENPIQIEYDQPTVSFHNFKDYYGKPYGKGFQTVEYSFSTSDKRYLEFVNSFNRKNLNNYIQVSSSIIDNEKHDDSKHKNYKFKVMGSVKNKLKTTKLSEADVNELLTIVESIKNQAGFDDTATIGDLKASYIKAVCLEQAIALRDKFIEDFPEIEPEKASSLAEYIVFNLVFSEAGVPKTNEKYSGETSSTMKKIFTDKELKSKLVKIKAFTKSRTGKNKNIYLDFVYKKIKETLNQSFEDVVNIFYLLGVEILSGTTSNLMTKKSAKKQSAKMTENTILALQDYYNFLDTDPMKKQLAHNIAKIEKLIVRQNRKLGISVDINDKADIIDKAKNLKIEAIEGIVYNFKEKTFKFTGSYAPINQILGFNTVGNFPSRFPRIYNKKIDWKVKAKTDSVLILPGAFKPPHLGHVNLIQHYLDKGVDEVLVMVTNPSSQKSLRKIGDKNINGNTSIVLWNIIAKDLISKGKIKIIISPAANPIEVAVSMIVKGATKLKPGTTVYLGASSKNTAEKIISTDQNIVGTETTVSEDAERYNRLLEVANINTQDLNIQDPEEHACPPIELPDQYIERCKSLGVYDSLPSQLEGKNPKEYHASDLRFLILEASKREEIKELLVYFLGSKDVIEKYMSYIF